MIIMKKAMTNSIKIMRIPKEMNKILKYFLNKIQKNKEIFSSQQKMAPWLKYKKRKRIMPLILLWKNLMLLKILNN